MGTNETTELADLALTNGQEAEVKGGPTRTLINPSTTSTTEKGNGNLQIAQFHSGSGGGL